jgi:hypothetical protein
MNGPDIFELLWAISRGSPECDGISKEMRAQLAADGLVSLDGDHVVLTPRASRLLREREAEVWREINPRDCNAPSGERVPR